MREQLERALAEQFDDEHLSVYADYLQSIGDPRGDLIALDRQPGPRSPHYDAAMAAWLGADLALYGRTGVEFRRGFVNVTLFANHLYESLDALLASPAAPYIFDVHMQGTPGWLGATLARLCERPRPWLRHLLMFVAMEDYGDPPSFVLDDARLAAATPALDTLRIEGNAVVRSLGHPRLRRLYVEHLAVDDAAALDTFLAASPRLVELATGDLQCPTPITLPPRVRVHDDISGYELGLD
jgi:hypothetical protein